MNIVYICVFTLDIGHGSKMLKSHRMLKEDKF